MSILLNWVLKNMKRMYTFFSTEHIAYIGYLAPQKTIYKKYKIIPFQNIYKSYFLFEQNMFYQCVWWICVSMRKRGWVGRKKMKVIKIDYSTKVFQAIVIIQLTLNGNVNILKLHILYKSKKIVKYCLLNLYFISCSLTNILFA